MKVILGTTTWFFLCFFLWYELWSLLVSRGRAQPITMVYGTYDYSYWGESKPTYICGASHCLGNETRALDPWMLRFCEVESLNAALKSLTVPWDALGRDRLEFLHAFSDVDVLVLSSTDGKNLATLRCHQTWFPGKFPFCSMNF